MVNEFRAGYNYDNSERASTFTAADVTSQLGIENAPSLGPDRRGFPQFQFTAGSNRPTNISDAGRNVDRTLRQNAFSVSDNLTWINGRPLAEGRAASGRATRPATGSASASTTAAATGSAAPPTGNAFTDFLLGLPTDVSDHISNRGPLQGYSNDIAGFVQDDWRANKSLTVFLGLRYEIVGAWHEDELTLANFRPVDGGYHVVPNEEVAALLPPGLIALGRTRTADEVGLPETLVNTDKNNFSPRVGLAWRLDESNKTVFRAGFGLFHPTVAVQGIRDLMATNEFRFGDTRRGGGLRNGFSGGTPFTDAADFGNQGIDPDLESPDIYQYNLTLERELGGQFGLRASYIGSTMRKLLVDRDHNTLQASTVPFDPENPADLRAAARSRSTASTWTTSSNAGERPVPLAAARADSAAGATGSPSTRRTRSPIPRATLRIPATAASAVSSSIPTTSRRTAVPIPTSCGTASSRTRPGTCRWAGAGKHGANMAGWANALFGGWTVSSIFQARSGQNLTPFFSGFYTTSPWNTGKPLDGLGNFFCCAWRPDQIANPNTGGTREAFFNQAAYALPGPGQLGNAKKGSLKGPGTWVVNFGFYKDVVTQGDFRLQFSALLDNAFNHPQFFPTYGSGFVDLTSFLIDERSRQRHDRSPGGRRHRKRGGVLAGTRHTIGVTGHILSLGGSGPRVLRSQVLRFGSEHTSTREPEPPSTRTPEPPTVRSVPPIRLDRDPLSRDHDPLHRSNGGDVGCRIVSKHDDVRLEARAQAPQLVALIEEGRRR